MNEDINKLNFLNENLFSFEKFFEMMKTEIHNSLRTRKVKGIITLFTFSLGVIMIIFLCFYYKKTTNKLIITQLNSDPLITKMPEAKGKRKFKQKRTEKIFTEDINETVNLNETDEKGNFLPSLPWETHWYKDFEFLNEKIKKPNSNCSLCDFKPTQIDPSSCDTDVIVTIAMGKIYGLPTTIRSIRTSQIHSAIVVLADSEAAASIQSDMQDIINDCGVNVIDVGDLTFHQMKGRYRTRWHLIYDYFRINPLKFTRFVMTDAYDSFFQGDIFMKSLKEDTIYFSTESINIGRCMHNSRWIKEIYPESLKLMKDKPIICAGPVAGGVKPLLEFCKLMFAVDMWEDKWITPPDQAYVNYVVRTNMLEENKIPYEVVPNDGFMTTVGYCDRKKELMVDENGNVGCPGFKTTPLLIHQYVRPKNMRGHMFHVCNSTNSNAFKRDPYSKASF